MELELVERRPDTRDVESFLFAPPEGFTWRPGQYLRYRLEHPDEDDRGVARYFTVASAPHEGVVRLTTRFAADRSSTFKRALQQLRPGDRVAVEGEAAGPFVLEELEGEHVFVAGGIGITPFRAILLDLERSGGAPPIQLLYANRNDEFAFREELDRAAGGASWLSIRYLVEPERVDAELLRREVANLDRATFWVSGPLPMVDALQGLLGGLGVDAERIRRDAFPGYS